MKEDSERVDRERVEELKRTASFVLDCPIKKLKLKELEDSYRFGVSGCEQRAIFHRHRGNWFSEKEYKKRKLKEAIEDAKREARNNNTSLHL